jgi:hypothetical protein
MRKVDGLSLHWFLCFTSQQEWDFGAAFWEHNPLRNLSHIYKCQQQRDLDRNQMFGTYHLYIDCTMWGTERNLVAPLLGVDISPSTETLNFLWERKEPISLIRLIKKCNLDNLYSKLRCHVVPKAFSISKNTATVDILSDEKVGLTLMNIFGLLSSVHIALISRYWKFFLLHCI